MLREFSHRLGWGGESCNRAALGPVPMLLPLLHTGTIPAAPRAVPARGSSHSEGQCPFCDGFPGDNPHCGTRAASAMPQSPVLWPDHSYDRRSHGVPGAGDTSARGWGCPCRVGAAWAVRPCSKPSRPSALGSLICSLTPLCYLQLLKAPIEPCL